VPTLAAESLESRALLTVTAALTGDGDLVIAYNAADDVLADIGSDGTNYTVTGSGGFSKQFKITEVTGIISVADKAAAANQTFKVLSGTALANPLQVNANVETTSLLGGITATKAGAVSIGSGTISLANDISTVATNANVTLSGATTLTKAVSITTGSGAGNILFSSTLDGTSAGNQNLTLTAGTGDVTFTGAVGGTTRLGAITIASAANVTANAVKAASLTQTAGTVATAINGAVNTNAAGGVSLTTEGTIAIAAAGDITTTNGPVSLTAKGGITTAGDVTTSGNNVTFGSATTLSGPVEVKTGSGAGNILFSSTLDGTTDGSENLTLTAGTGDVTFTGVVGGTTPLGAITIASAANVTANAVTAASLTQTAGTVTTALNGAVNTNAAAGVSLTTAGTIAIADDGDITTTSGPVSLTATGGITTAGNVTTSGNNVTFASATTLSGNVAIATGVGAGDIKFSSTLDGSKQVTLDAGTGAVAFNAAVGSTTPLAGITLTSAGSTKADSSIKLAKSADSGQDGLTVAAGVNNVEMTKAGSSITGFAGNGISFLGGSTNSQLEGFAVTQNALNGMSFAVGSYAGTKITNNSISKNGDFVNHVGNGILVQGSELMIGGDALASSNTVGNKIFKNGLNGIEITGSAAAQNAILSNSIYLNGQDVTAVVDGDTTLLGEGIKLSAGGNGAQVAPQIFDVVRNAATGKIHVQVNVPAAGNYLVQLFANNAADEQDIFPADTKGFQGRRFVGASPTAMPVVGNKLTPIEVDPSLVSKVAPGDWITATATLLDGTTQTTSEFSAGVQAGNVQPLGAGGDGQATWLSAPAVPGQLINRYANELAYKAVNANTIEIRVAGQMSLPQLTIYTNRNARNQVVNPRATSLVNTEVTLAPTGGTNAFGKVNGVSRTGNTAMRLTLSGVSLTPQSAGFLVLGTPALPAARLYDAANPAGGPTITVGSATSPASSSHYDMVAALTDPSVVGIDGKGAVTNAQALAFVSRFQGGMRVATADVNGDGFIDLVTAPGNAGTGFAGNVFGDAPRIITIYNGNPAGTWRTSSINLSGESSLAAYTGGFQVSLANLRGENTGSGNAIAELVVASSNQVFVYELNVKARGEKPEIIPKTAVPPITTGGTITGLATGTFSDSPLADIVVATTTATPAQVTKWLSSADKSLAEQITSSVTLYSAAAAFAPTNTFTLADNLYNGAPTTGGRPQNVFLAGASLAVADIDNAPDQRPELILGAQFMGMGNFRVLANDVVKTGSQADVNKALSAGGQFGRAPRGTVGVNQVWQPTGGPDFFTTDKSAANENLLAVAPTGLGFNAPLSVAAAQINGDFKSRVFAALGATNGTPGRVRAFEWSPLPPPLVGGVWTGTTELDVESGVSTQKARLPRGSGLRLG
jgi:hypothetical protein